MDPRLAFMRSAKPIVAAGTKTVPIRQTFSSSAPRDNTVSVLYYLPKRGTEKAPDQVTLFFPGELGLGNADSALC